MKTESKSRLLLVILAALALAVPLIAAAATTWYSPKPTLSDPDPRAYAVNTTGSESAPVDAITTAGLDLNSVESMTVCVESTAMVDAGTVDGGCSPDGGDGCTNPQVDGGYGAFTAGKLLAYLYNPQSTRWSRAADLDLTVPAANGQCFSGFYVLHKRGRIAYVPSGLGLANRVYLNAQTVKAK
jgi:hypothetical protein